MAESDANLELHQFSRLNESMKNIILSSRQINILALNAMFMILSSKNEQGSFSKVTSLFREFSARLNVQMNENLHLSVNMSEKAARYKLYARHDQLVINALNDPRARYIKDSFKTGTRSKLALKALLQDKQKFQQGIIKSIRLIGEAETLSLLTKVEAEHSGIDKNTANNLTRKLEETIYNININIKECTSAVAA